eukprot:XP_001691130.1 predicted protein [Chlamydomonas reinhardtii]
MAILSVRAVRADSAARATLKLQPSEERALDRAELLRRARAALGGEDLFLITQDGLLRPEDLVQLPAVLGRVLPPYQPQLSESELLQLQAEVADDELEFGCPSFVFASSRSNRSQLMSVSVLQVIGNTKFTISDLVPSDTVEYLKARVCATAGIPPAQQCLVWHCKLENGRTLADCNIKDKSTDLVQRARGGGKPR